jgi:hypothetical protein
VVGKAPSTLSKMSLLAAHQALTAGRKSRFWTVSSYLAGARDEELMEHTGRWHLATMRHYVRRAKLSKGAASARLNQQNSSAAVSGKSGTVHFASATSSISTRAPSGSAATPMVVRAG